MREGRDGDRYHDGEEVIEYVRYKMDAGQLDVYNGDTYIWRLSLYDSTILLEEPPQMTGMRKGKGGEKGWKGNG